MKKLLVVICLLFPLVVNAKEDKLTIETLDTYIVILGTELYSFEEKVNTNLYFGDNPNTNYYIRKIPKSFDYQYTKKSKPTLHNVETQALDVLDYQYTVDFSDKNSTIVYVGDAEELLGENETITLSYINKYIGKNVLSNKEYHFDIAKSDYDIKKVNFEIILTDEARRGTIYFSNNNKDYFETLDGLTYKKDEYSGLTGTYTKTLTKGQSLSIKIILSDEDRTDKLDFREVVVYGSLGVFILFIFIVIFKIINRKKKK